MNDLLSTGRSTRRSDASAEMAAGRAEIEEALDEMDRLRAASSEAGDWTIWADCLAEDA